MQQKFLPFRFNIDISVYRHLTLLLDKYVVVYYGNENRTKISVAFVQIKDTILYLGSKMLSFTFALSFATTMT